MEVKRREFLKYATGGMTALFVGSNIPQFLRDEALAKKKPVVYAQTLNFQITDVMKNMATYNTFQVAPFKGQCYYWVYKEDHLPADCPGPIIYAVEGDAVQIVLTNDLDEPHALCIPGIFDSGPIQPGQTFVGAINLKKKKGAGKKKKTGLAGTYLYYDNLNEPVNRVMGLHGAFIVMPANYHGGTATMRVSPYTNPPPRIQQLFNDLGSKPWWPGLAWEQGDPATWTPTCRQYCWVLHQASPNLFAEVGDYAPGQDYPAAQFLQKFLKEPIEVGLADAAFGNTPTYFTISGQSGHFSHNTPYICPNNRVGEPAMIRILNAGLWSHSMHIHANHVYVTAVTRNGVRSFESFPGQPDNPLWVDVYTLDPMTIVDWLVPYMRPPDVPNERGIGRADTPLMSQGQGGTFPHPTWPPAEEQANFFPDNLTANDMNGNPISLAVQLSNLCYPMHDHSEPSQTAQGGNYNMGMISGINFIGDRNTPGGVTDFRPGRPVVYCPGTVNYQATPGCYPPAVPPPWIVP